jgi:dTDP-4-dehydrorhamnose reductase
MRLLVTGATGQVGFELARGLMPLGEVVAVDRGRCDLSHPHAIPALIDSVQPDVIVNAAAYTAVDRAEQEESLATTINGTAVGVLAEEARKRGALLIHYSTDYVFDGAKPGPYTERDIASPLNAYGRSKLCGEVAIQQVVCDHLILRTSWVYAARGQNFVKTVLRLSAERQELRIVADQIGAPTPARLVADATALILGRLSTREAWRSASGTYHLTTGGETSWHGFATAIVAAAREVPRGPSMSVKRILPIATSDYPLPARRPLNSRLDCTKLAQTFDLYLPDWRTALTSTLDGIFEDGS